MAVLAKVKVLQAELRLLTEIYQDLQQRINARKLHLAEELCPFKLDQQLVVTPAGAKEQELLLDAGDLVRVAFLELLDPTERLLQFSVRLALVQRAYRSPESHRFYELEATPRQLRRWFRAE